MALQSLRQIPRPILLSLVPQGLPPIVIDLRDLTYDWDLTLEQFPVSPGVVLVGTYALEGDDRSLSRRSLSVEPLLWMIGLNAFGGGRASWLRSGERYRLKRWPDLSLLPHTPEQLRAIKTVAKGLMTVEKLSAKAGVDLRTAHQVINALSLMALLRRIESRSGAPMMPPVPPEFEAPVRIGRHSTRRGG
jgi:hypothetical protein